MLIVHRFVEEPESCPYLPEQRARHEYRVARLLSASEYEACMDAGWRKFGHFLFRPICESCTACRPLRVLAGPFEPNRSQRRALSRNADLTVQFGEPTVDEERFDLFRRYHEAQSERKQWPNSPRSIEDYRAQFVENPVPGVEISVREGERLVAVALADVTPKVLSAVYHYHEPEMRERSLGTFVILQCIAFANWLGRPYAALGYYVPECGSLSYKARYRPCEVLGSDGVWRALESAAPAED